jgi:hypothetical protein
MVCEGRLGSIAIEYRGRALPYREIPAPARPNVGEKRPIGKHPTEQRAKPKWVPPAHHPWREAVRRELQKRELKKVTVATRPSLALPSASP